MTDKEHIIWLRSRIVGWLVFINYPFTYGIAYLFLSSPEARQVYFYIYFAGSIFPLAVSVALHFFKLQIIQVLLLLSAISPLLSEAAIFYPLNGGILWWSCLVAGYVGTFLFPAKDWKKAIALVVGVGLLALLVAFFHSYTARFPANEVSHGVWRFGLVLPAMVMVGILAILLNRDLQNMLLQRQIELGESLQKQEELASALEQEKEEADRRRAEAEAALAEVARLRAEEIQRAAREAFLMRYETLMRTSYELSPAEFARKVLESLTEELTLLGGFFYKRREVGWEVIAAYAFPHKIGYIIESDHGILRVAALVKEPFLVSPCPPGTLTPYSSLLRIKPIGILYLPLYSEATNEVVAIIELLIGNIPSKETRALLALLLPRLGTYLWSRASNALSYGLSS